MARKSHISSLKQMGEINLTPLMDLTFILLITFIITFPLIEQGIPVDLPEGKARKLDAARTSTASPMARPQICDTVGDCDIADLAET